MTLFSLPKLNAWSRRLTRAVLGTVIGSIVSNPVRAQVGDTASVRAEALFAAKDYIGAASAFQALTTAHPQHARYWTRLGTSLQLAGRADDAETEEHLL